MQLDHAISTYNVLSARKIVSRRFMKRRQGDGELLLVTWEKNMSARVWQSELHCNKDH
ncbi:hypothetical protein L905_12540 [Agrobacterium sp. TS43]|nr:hypothetical protein L905_12540 [Agrobacterium sp. TS43]